MKELNKPDIDSIREISEELAIDPSFLEKDWYATQALKIISQQSTKFIFSGGTCLSKAYDLIERFSEDLDFKIAEKMDRTKRKLIIGIVEKELKNSKLFDTIAITKENQSKKITIELTYSHSFSSANTLRPHIKVEIVFTENTEPTENKNVGTFCDKHLKISENLFAASCANPLKTAAEKFSALLWRVPNTDRTMPLHTIKNDPTLMRHLYDLFALKKLISGNKSSFISLVHAEYEKDKKRSAQKNRDITQAISDTLQKLSEDKKFEEDYKNFVQAMSYANDDKQVSFKAALDNFETISKIIIK